MMMTPRMMNVVFAVVVVADAAVTSMENDSDVGYSNCIVRFSDYFVDDDVSM